MTANDGFGKLKENPSLQDCGPRGGVSRLQQPHACTRWRFPDVGYDMLGRISPPYRGAMGVRGATVSAWDLYT